MKQFSKNIFIENGYISASKKKESAFVDTHFHDFFELEYIISGNGKYVVDGKEYSIRSGDLFFLTPFNFHCVDIKNAEFYNVMFSENICDASSLQNLSQAAPVITNSKENIFEILLEELCNNKDISEYRVSLLNTIIKKLELTTLKSSPKGSLSSIKKAELYILTNFRNELTLNKVANEAALAPTYFSKLFKSEKGINFKTYLNNLRFNYAKKLLNYSEMTIMQICNESGFNDYPNFIRRFKEKTGHSPAEYRKLKRASKINLDKKM